MKTSGLRAVCLAALLWCCLTPVRAQVISIKTVPIAQGDQFELFPSHNLGMGSASIALTDSVHDPFVNPATAARLRGVRFFSSPTIYSLSRGTGGGRALPFAAVGRIADWFGGVALAFQQVDPSRSPDEGRFLATIPPPPPPPPGGTPTIPDEVVLPTGPDRDAHANRYTFATFGRAWPDRRASIGASVFWNDLHALDGVDLLYAGSRRVVQTGHSLDVRVGMLKEWGAQGERSLQGIVVHNRFAARHDVTYADLYWDPATAQFRERGRLEHNDDRTNVWGLQLKYDVAVATSGWRVGWLLTANRASHPKIPEYELANVPVIPRDPGRSTAYQVGMGLSRRRGTATFGMDLILEPIRSYTWADAAAPVITTAGDTIATGGKTIENRFRFMNTLLRIGTAQEFTFRGPGQSAEIQLGLIVRNIAYRLHQQDNVQLADRQARTSWMEWSPTWGLSVRFPDLELRYRGRVTHGAGRPGVSFFGVGVRDMAIAGGSILAAPNGPFTLTGVSSTTHQISLSVPLR